MELTQLMRKAIMYAVWAHDGHKDKSGFPYIAHPMRVALAVIEYGETEFCAAMLHDVVEDCGATLDDIEEKFNRDIRDTVDSVSRRIYANGTKEKYADFILRSKQHPSGRLICWITAATNASCPYRSLNVELFEDIEKHYW
jgi:(p)ppGpp synthase/HD superfamily hydrolase